MRERVCISAKVLTSVSALQVPVCGVAQLQAHREWSVGIRNRVVVPLSFCASIPYLHLYLYILYMHALYLGHGSPCERAQQWFWFRDREGGFLQRSASLTYRKTVPNTIFCSCFLQVFLIQFSAPAFCNLQPKRTDMHRSALAKATSPKLPKYCTRLRYQHVMKTPWSVFSSFTLQDPSILTRISTLLSSSLQSFGRVVLYPHDPCSLYIWKAWGVLVTPLSRNCC